jgi:hypothetical protein
MRRNICHDLVDGRDHPGTPPGRYAGIETRRVPEPVIPTFFSAAVCAIDSGHGEHVRFVRFVPFKSRAEADLLLSYRFEMRLALFGLRTLKGAPVQYSFFRTARRMIKTATVRTARATTKIFSMMVAAKLIGPIWSRLGGYGSLAVWLMRQDSDHAVLLPNLDIAVDDVLFCGGDSGLIALRLDDVQLNKLTVSVPQICSVLPHGAASLSGSR